jgi:hypothetical protein
MSRGPRIFGAILIASVVLFFSIGCQMNEDDAAKPPKAGGTDQGLLTAYELLESTLGEETRLGMLGIFKRLTFQRPVPEIEDIMKRMSATSKKRVEELEELRRVAPDVSSPPEFTDPIGEAITSGATKLGMKEMVDFGGSFGIRFIFLQAQATRMVNAIANAAAELETQPDRKKWLIALGAEYEGFRDELVVIVEKYVLQEGAVKPE